MIAGIGPTSLAAYRRDAAKQKVLVGQRVAVGLSRAGGMIVPSSLDADMGLYAETGRPVTHARQIHPVTHARQIHAPRSNQKSNLVDDTPFQGARFFATIRASHCVGSVG
jgi:hypothetical protein